MIDSFLELLATMQANWSWLELAWTVAAVYGIIKASQALSRATRLIVAMHRENVNWMTRRRTIKRVRDAAGAWCRMIGWTVLGISAMASPPPATTATTSGVVGAIVLLGVITWDLISIQWDETDWKDIVGALVRDPTLWRELMVDEERASHRAADVILPKEADGGHEINL